MISVNAMEPIAIIPPVPTAALLHETRCLSAEQVLVVSEPYVVFHAGAAQIPNTLREIGRLREITFREENEGTGKAVDLDEFDSHYVHLFLWNEEEREIVGAYRLGKTDEILRRFGKQGLYTSTLFDYEPDLLDRINPALELGRLFVRSEYQRAFPPLFLLWKGIAQYVARHPRYHKLFGPVTIANDYQSITKQLIVNCLSGPGYRHELAELVRAKTPFRNRPEHHWCFQAAPTDIEEVSAIISGIEKDRRGIPIMLKQYLKLGGKLLGFNIDASFCDVLDGLILVDLTQTDFRMLARLMGEEAAERFLNLHRTLYDLAS